MTTSAKTMPPRIFGPTPRLDGNEREYVLECMDTTWISSVGRFISEFEQGFAQYNGVRNSIACTNGDVALHLCLVALGVGEGDEVILPTLASTSAANAVIYSGATPIFVDTEPGSLTLDVSKISTLINPRTKAIIPAHLYGHVCDMSAIVDIANANGLKVISDAADAIGVTFGGDKVGALGDCAIFNFNDENVITTGEGGMITTNDDELATKIRLLRGQGMDPHRRYWFPIVGYNYRMTNIQAAIGLAQLERVEEHLAARRQVSAWYETKLSQLADRIVLLPDSANNRSNAPYTALLGGEMTISRDQALQSLEASGIECAPVFNPIHLMPPYAQFARGDLLQAQMLSASSFNLPHHAGLTEQDVDRVVSALQQILNEPSHQT